MAHISGDVDYSVDDIYGIVEKLHRAKKETVKSGGSEVPIPFWFLDKMIDLVWSVADISEDNKNAEEVEYDECFIDINYDDLDFYEECLMGGISRSRR